jgi:prepilin-type N-terminal cleavage/methylation domain-containing protein
MSMKHHRPLKFEGFTLVEILVVIAVAAVVIVSLNSVVTGYMHVAQRGRNLSLANAYIEAKVEALRNTGYNGLNLGTSSLTSELPAQLPPSRSASMVVASPSGGLKQVDITVSYNDQGQSNTYAYTTYVGELGVGQ